MDWTKNISPQLITALITATIKKVLSTLGTRALAGNEAVRLKCSTQHTYVEGSDPLGSYLAPICCSPFASQAEYNLAVMALKNTTTGNISWNESKDAQKALAINHLGRSLHYIQDITVPHHCEIPGNYPDIAKGYYNLTGSPKQDFEYGSSQNYYEIDFMKNNYYFQDGNFNCVGNPQWYQKLLIDNIFISRYSSILSERDVSSIQNGVDEYVLAIRNYVINTKPIPKQTVGRFMDFVDGWEPYVT